jgi:hypothetical protein
MGICAARTGDRSARRGVGRPTLFLLGLLVCMLFVPAAAANANVKSRYRAGYKSKLTSYERKMDKEYDFFSAWNSATQSHRDIIQVALNDPELQQQIPQLESAALDERALLRDALAQSRTAIYANIAAFKATAVDWFKTTADKSRVKARLATMKSGFTQIFSADESFMNALSALGMSADVGTATNEIMAAGLTRTTAEDQFEKGMTQLHALE